MSRVVPKSERFANSGNDVCSAVWDWGFHVARDLLFSGAIFCTGCPANAQALLCFSMALRELRKRQIRWRLSGYSPHRANVHGSTSLFDIIMVFREPEIVILSLNGFHAFHTSNIFRFVAEVHTEAMTTDELRVAGNGVVRTDIKANSTSSIVPGCSPAPVTT